MNYIDGRCCFVALSGNLEPTYYYHARIKFIDFDYPAQYDFVNLPRAASRNDS